MNKRAIITSALPYANGEIHLGHVASTYLPADVTTRFLKQNGVEAYYVCASDDFGTPILIQSEKEGKTTDKVEGIDAAGLKALSEKESVSVFDVRKPGEYLSEHIPDAKSTPLDFINEHMNEFPTEKPFYMHCAGGYRSMIAASILKSRGIHNLIDIKGGFGAIKESGMKVSDYICPSTL